VRYLLICYLIGFFLVIACAYWFFIARRRKRLLRRVPRPLEAILDELNLTEPRERQFFAKVLRRLAKHLDVSPTVLRASDRFEHELGLSSVVGLPDVDLEMFFAEVRGFLRRAGVPQWPKYSVRGKSLGNLAVDLKESLRASAPPESLPESCHGHGLGGGQKEMRS